MKYDKGVIGPGPVVIKDITLDAVVFLYHHIAEDIGVQRLQPDQALTPGRSGLDLLVEPHIMRYAEHLQKNRSQVRAKVIGGVYRWNVYEWGYLLEKYQNSLKRNLMNFLERKGLHSVEFVATEERAIKTLIMNANGIISKEEYVPEENRRKAIFAYDIFADRMRRNS